MRQVSDAPAGFAFPCSYAIKAMGVAEPGFDALVIDIIRQHCPEVHAGSVTTRPSRTGRYLAVTVVIEARSRAQLDAIYADLTAHDKVLTRL